jgi:hypothetical protein
MAVIAVSPCRRSRQKVDGLGAHGSRHASPTTATGDVDDAGDAGAGERVRDVLAITPRVVLGNDSHRRCFRFGMVILRKRGQRL